MPPETDIVSDRTLGGIRGLNLANLANDRSSRWVDSEWIAGDRRRGIVPAGKRARNGRRPLSRPRGLRQRTVTPFSFAKGYGACLNETGPGERIGRAG